MTPNDAVGGYDDDTPRTTKELGVTGAGYAKACRDQTYVRMRYGQSDPLWRRLRPYICLHGENAKALISHTDAARTAAHPHTFAFMENAKALILL